MITKFFALIAITFLACTGCTCSPKNAKQSGDAAKIINLAIWANYIPPSLVMEFEQAHNYKVEITHYASNEELLAKLQAGATGFDVIVPSDYMVEVMVKLDLLQTLDHAQIPNAARIDISFKNKTYDPLNTYSLPYAWLVTGIAVNRRFYTGEVKSWSDLLANPKVYGKLSLLDDARETLGAALRYNDSSLNSTSMSDLFKAKEVLTKLRPHIKAFTSDPIASITSGDVVIAHMYSSDALQAARNSGGKVEFIMPGEGGTLAIDNLAVPKGARNTSGAHALINFLLHEASSLAMVQGVLAGPVLAGIRERLPEELRKLQALSMDPLLLTRYEMMRDLGDATMLYDKIWTELKADSE